MPNPRATKLPHPQSYDASTGSYVVDQVTQLIWQIAPDPQARTWSDAMAYCASLTSTDTPWRVPSRVELMSIVDYTATPAVGTPALQIPRAATTFWTSSHEAGDNSAAWTVNFAGGVTTTILTAAMVGTNNAHVRCVRSRRSGVRAARYVIASGVVTDTQTGLSWQQVPESQPLSETDAAAACAELQLGSTGWRLPSIGELQTLVDETRHGPSIDPTAFPDTPADYFWSQSPLDGSPGFDWAMSFDYGLALVMNSGAPRYVRCVL